MDKAYLFKGLAHIGIPTVDINGAVDFYCNMLGFEVVMSDQVNAGEVKIQIVIIKQGSCIIELVERSDVNKLDTPTIHLALEVSGINHAVTELKSKGVVFETEEAAEKPSLGGIKNIFFSGPNHEKIELLEMIQ